MIKVYLHNVRAILSRPGYGEGTTHAAAVQAALDLARRQDPEAHYNEKDGTVDFRGVVRL